MEVVGDERVAELGEGLGLVTALFGSQEPHFG